MDLRTKNRDLNMPKMYSNNCKVCGKDYIGRGKKYCSYQCMYSTQKDEGNNAWVGNNISYQGVHNYVRTRLPHYGICQECGLEKKTDLANVTGIYQRDLTNWKWLCRSCHWKLDKKINNILGL